MSDKVTVEVSSDKGFNRIALTDSDDNEIELTVESWPIDSGYEEDLQNALFHAIERIAELENENTTLREKYIALEASVYDQGRNAK